MDRLPPPTADFDLQLFSDPWRIVVSVGDSIVGSASLLPILPICLTPVESREVYHIPTDVHVLRCSIALGWIPKTISDPDLGSCILESWLPKDEWQSINPMFGSFGQLLQNPATRWKCTDAHMDFTVRRLDKDRRLPNKKQIYNLYNNFIRIYRSYSI